MIMKRIISCTTGRNPFIGLEECFHCSSSDYTGYEQKLIQQAFKETIRKTVAFLLQTVSMENAGKSMLIPNSWQPREDSFFLMIYVALGKTFPAPDGTTHGFSLSDRQKKLYSTIFCTFFDGFLYFSRRFGHLEKSIRSK